MKKLVFLGVAILLLSGLFFYQVIYTEEKGKESPVQGGTAPNFTLSDLTGKKVELKEIYRENNITIVNFWATWCPPCRGEIPEFNRFYEAYKDQKVQIVAVNIQEESEQVLNFAKGQKMKFPILLDSKGEVARAYYINAIPTSFIINRQGEILRIHRGMMVYSQLEAIIQEYLPKK